MPITENPTEAVRGPHPVYEFHPFRLDCGRFELERKGQPLRVERKPMELLILLVSREGQLVTRQEIAERLWSSEVFVDTEHGINTAIRKLRFLLQDDPESPRFIQTVTGRGYRFVAPIVTILPAASVPPAAVLISPVAEVAEPLQPVASSPHRKLWGWYVAACVCVLLFAAAVGVLRSRHGAHQVQFTQLTDFADSAIAPALSPDGHMLAFIRGSNVFTSAAPIYVKMLPNGEAKEVTDDRRQKYGLAFSPDGSEITYTVLVNSDFSTYAVSTLGGDPHLFEKNSAGLVWLDSQRLLFSEIRPGDGIHLGVVEGRVESGDRRAIYFPAHDRGMAHSSFPSPDRAWALVAEMNENGDWGPCRLISLEAKTATKIVGPMGNCTSAGWSPDGRTMYFTAYVDGRSHIWRQRFPDGQAEQLTFGPTEESGLAVEPDGRGLITSVGASTSTIWIRAGDADRQLSSEGEVWGSLSFSPDDNFLYYLYRQGPAQSAELWRTYVDSAKSEPVFPGIAMTAFNLSADGRQVVFTTDEAGKPGQLWWAPLDKSLPPTRLSITGARSPHFGPNGRILFQFAEGGKNYLEQIDLSGLHRSKVFQNPIIDLVTVSPGGRWVTGSVPSAPNKGLPAVMALPVDGGAPRQLCAAWCLTSWSTDGKFLFVSTQSEEEGIAGRTLAIPVGPGESLPDLPSQGVDQHTDLSLIPGAQSIPRFNIAPGKDPQHYAWVNWSDHRNLYRVSFP